MDFVNPKQMQQISKERMELTMMNKETFVNEVLKLVTNELGCGYNIDVRKVLKNNNMTLTGLIIGKRNNAIGITIYLEDYYNDYMHGRSMQSIVEHILRSYANAAMSEAVNLQFTQSKDEMLKRVAYRIVNKDMNKDLLSQCPYTHVAGDLVKLYFLHVECGDGGFGSTTITYSLMERYGLSVEEIEYHANINTPEFFPVSFCSMGAVLGELLDDYEEETNELGMWILTNNQKTYGASAMLYDGILNKISSRLRSDLYIIPSSLHELIILRATNDYDKKALGMMIHEVNRTQVSQEELLSDTLYYFTQTTNKISVA